MSSPPPQDVIVVAIHDAPDWDTCSWSDNHTRSASPHSELRTPTRGRSKKRRKRGSNKRILEKQRPKVIHDRTRSLRLTRRKSSIIRKEESRLLDDSSPKKQISASDKAAELPEHPKEAAALEEAVKKEEEEDNSPQFSTSSQPQTTNNELNHNLACIPVALFAYLADLGWVEHPTDSDLQTAAINRDFKHILYNFSHRLYSCYQILTSSKFRYHSEGCKEYVELGLDYHTLVRSSKTRDDWIAYPCGTPVAWLKGPKKLQDGCHCKDDCCQGRLRRCPAVHCWAPLHCVDQLYEHLQQHEHEPMCVQTKGVGLMLYPWRYQRALWWSIISNSE